VSGAGGGVVCMAVAEVMSRDDRPNILWLVASL